MKAIDRIMKYIDFKGFNNSSFEKHIDVSNGYIGTQLKRNADLGEGILNKILDNCLDINPEWLLTGKGSMLREPAGPAPDPDLPEVRKQISRLLELLDQKDREIKELKKELESKSDAERKQLERTLEELKKGRNE